MNKILEHKFKIKEGEKLSELLIDGFREHHDVQEFYGSYGHMVHIETIPKQVIYGRISPSIKDGELNFCKSLESIDFTDFRKLLLLVSTYPEYSKLSEPADLVLEKPNAQIGMLLQETNGWIVYKHQLEQLFYMTTNCNSTEAIKLRKQINAKKAVTLSELSKIEVDGVNLKNLVQSRLKFGFSCTPRYREAHILYNYLNNN